MKFVRFSRDKTPIGEYDVFIKHTTDGRVLLVKIEYPVCSIVKRLNPNYKDENSEPVENVVFDGTFELLKILIDRGYCSAI